MKTGKDNELWLQTRVGQFREVGTAWGVGDVCGRSHYVAFLDANGDAYPDLFVGNAPPRAVTGDPCDNPANGLPSEQSKLFLNQGGTGFRSVTQLGHRRVRRRPLRRGRRHQPATAGTTCWSAAAPPPSSTATTRGTGFTNVAGANGLAATHTDADVRRPGR